MQKFSGFKQLLHSFETEQPEGTALFVPGPNGPVAVSRAVFSAAVKEEAARLAGACTPARAAPSDTLEAFNAPTGTTPVGIYSGKSCLGILCDGTYECILTIFASVLAGLQIVLLDENASDELLAAQIKETDINALWGDEELCEELQPYLTKGIEITDPGRILFFTSGTTASCKAIVLTDQTLMAAAYNGSCMLPLSPEDTLLCMLPLNHVFGMVCGLLWGMQCGAAVALGRGVRHYADDPQYFGPTALSAVPLLLGFLLQHATFNEGLRLILVGGGDCPRELLAAANAKGIRVSFGYGLTETSSGIAISVSGDPYALEICPEDTVTLAPDGEILVRSPSCMMLGYYKRPDDTESVLRNGILYTGDLGRWDADGRLHIIGRKKEILVLRDGTKIFLPEYEASISRALPGRDFAVLSPDGRPILLLLGREEERAEIQGKLKETMSSLPRGQQLSGICFTDKPMPRTTTGKIKRWELEQGFSGQD